MDSALYLLGVNHRTADLSARECFALPDPVAEQLVVALNGGITETVCLSTCNRVEILAVGKNAGAPELILRHWAAVCGKGYEDLAPYVYVLSGRDAVTHLFSVASSLDSLVLGEPQILGQLKDAYRKALARGTAKLVLNRLLHKAFMTAKRVRAETSVASSAVSVSYAAVELAKRIFGDLAGRRVLLVGAGEMAELAAMHLANHGARVQVTNRTYERALALAERFGGEPWPFDALLEHLERADIAVSSTGAHAPVITTAAMRGVMKRRKNRPLFIIDIAVPRDVEAEVNKLDNVYVYTVDDLSEVVESNRAFRRDEAVKAGVIVEEEADRFQEWLSSLGVHSTIGAVVQRSERIARQEMAKTMRRLGKIDPELEAAVTDMLHAVMKKMNHDPIRFIKRRFSEEETEMEQLEFVRKLFNLDNGCLPASSRASRRRG